MTTQTYPIVTQTQASEFTTANIVIKSRTFSDKTDNTDFTLAKKRRISQDAVEEDDQQNVVDEDIYEECGDGDGDLQQTDNVMNDEEMQEMKKQLNSNVYRAAKLLKMAINHFGLCRHNRQNIKVGDTSLLELNPNDDSVGSIGHEWSGIEINYFLDIYEAHMKCLDDNDAKKRLWPNISSAMHEMGYFRSSNDCCDKWKDLCRSIQCGGIYNRYATERVRCLLDEVINNYSPNNVIEEKMVSPSKRLQADEYFEIMV